ncbi:hypothetical protein [Lysobacter fragariae]
MSTDHPNSEGSDHSETEVVSLLREIRNNQRAALELQREHMGMYQKQLERIERINDRAESIQRRAGTALRLILMLAIPAVLVLLALMLWPYFSRLLG